MWSSKTKAGCLSRSSLWTGRCVETRKGRYRAPRWDVLIKLPFAHLCFPHQVLFGLDVTSVVTREGGKVPTIIQRCVAFVETMGVDEPGLYRKPGRLTDVRALKDLFIADGKAKIPESIVDVDTVASLLKLYLREMPEPLFTNALHTELIDAAKSATTDDYAALVRVLRKLPEAHLDTINYLFRHLRTVVSASALNKMTAENLATCFGPSLVTPSNSDQTVDALMVSVGKDNQAIERLISLPAVLEEALAAQGGAAPDRQDARRIHRARSSLQYIPVETEYRKVIGALHSPITTFSQFRELCYELGCRASDVDYADAVSGCVGGALMDYRRFHAWVNRSRLVHFVNRTPQKRLGIIQAITYFQFFDKDNDGTIDATEWPELHSDLRKHYVLSDDPAECLAELDADGDGVVGLEEYLAWCLQPVPDVSHRLNSKGNPPPATQPRLGKAKSTPSTSNRPQAEPEFYDRS
jgi:hypothetical protein